MKADACLRPLAFKELDIERTLKYLLEYLFVNKL